VPVVRLMAVHQCRKLYEVSSERKWRTEAYVSANDNVRSECVSTMWDHLVLNYLPLTTSCLALLFAILLNTLAAAPANLRHL
jgi:hypothetical protein